MGLSDRRNQDRMLLKAITAVVFVLAVIDNGWVFLANPFPFWMLGYIPTILILSYFLFRWLRFRLRDDVWALLGIAVAAAAWPWTWYFSVVASAEFYHVWPKSMDVAWLFGPLVPYALLAALGLWKRQ